MKNVQLQQATTVETPDGQLKESIRDMIRLQCDYQISDEMFWEIFNARVLLNEHLDVDGFLNELNISVARV